jgi:hypothetical protein
VIIYGAGVIGKKVAYHFRLNEFSNSKLVIWDENYKNIGSISGYAVTEPKFENFADKHAPIVIALHPVKNSELILELTKRFENFGFHNFIALLDIPQVIPPTVIRSDDFYAEVKKHEMYECEYQDDMDFSDCEPKVKALAYYLPQFHDIPENDKWWGKGFTEWTNTRNAKPQFAGHYQPREPHDDLGYYDLSDAEVIRKQAAIAKRHGIYGWCIYYYWFSGKKLLEKPINLLLENKDIDIHFCLEWANESWTKSWVGDNKEIIMEQRYLEDDPEKFIADLKRYTDDNRYIRVNGKPLVIIYYPQQIPNLKGMIRSWREQARKIDMGELCVLVNCKGYTPKMLNIEHDVDGAAAFSFHLPLFFSGYNTVKEMNGETEYAHILNYAEYTDKYMQFMRSDREYQPFYRACFPCWDNTARYNKDNENYITTNYYFSLREFYRMAKANVEEACEMNKEFTFVFSWNEWCEGAYLEPDKKYGYAVINTLSKAICGLSFDFNPIV